MKFIKTSLLLLLCAFTLFTLTSCKKNGSENLLKEVQKRGKIVAGVKFDSKPFGYIDKDQQLKGYDIDLVREIAGRLLGDKNAVEFQQVTSSNRIFAVNSGTVDLVAATMTINEKRRKIVDFSDTYFVAGQAVMVHKNSTVKAIRDLNGKKTAIILGSTSEEKIKELAPNAEILGFRTYTDGFSALKSGRADAMTTDDTILMGFLAENHGFKILKYRYTQEPYGIAFKKSRKTQTFQKAVNDALFDMKNDGTLAKIRKKWIINE